MNCDGCKFKMDLEDPCMKAGKYCKVKIQALTAELEKANKRIDGSVQLTKLLERAEAELDKHRWIPVEERLPDYSDKFLEGKQWPLPRL